jgi:type IV secretory pathway VirB10-like protein
MMRLVGRALLLPLALVLMFAATPVADQSVVVKPTTPPETQTPPDKTKETPQKPTGEKPAAQPPAPTTPPARPVAPDVAALQAAQKITDNDKKIAALEKWLTDFPESGSKQQAYSALFDTLVKHRPTDRTAIMAVAQRPSTRVRELSGGRLQPVCRQPSHGRHLPGRRSEDGRTGPDGLRGGGDQEDADVARDAPGDAGSHSTQTGTRGGCGKAPEGGVRRQS